MGKFKEVVLACKGHAGDRQKFAQDIARARTVKADRDAPVGQRAQRIAPSKSVTAVKQPDGCVLHAAQRYFAGKIRGIRFARGDKACADRRLLCLGLCW